MACIFLPPLRHSQWLLSDEEFRQVVAPRVQGCEIDHVMFCFRKLAPRYRAQLGQLESAAIDTSS